MAQADPQNDIQAVEEPPQQQQQQQPQQQGFSTWGLIKSMVMRMLFIYFVSTLFRRNSTPSTPSSSSYSSKASISAINIFPAGTLIDLYVYLSESENFVFPTTSSSSSSSSSISSLSSSSLFWFLEEVKYGVWEGGHDDQGTYFKSGQIPLTHNLENNGSIFLHVFVAKHGFPIDPSNLKNNENTNDKNNGNNDNGFEYNPQFIIYKKKQLNKYKKRKFHVTKNLLTGETGVQEDMIKPVNESSSFEVLSFWHQNLTLNLVNDQNPLTKDTLPSPIDEYIEFVPGDLYYKPILYFNDYWNLNQDYKPINNTIQYLNFTLTFHPLSIFKWQLYASQSMQSKKWYQSIIGGESMDDNDEEQDTIKTTLLDTNPYLLFITVSLSIIHSIFEFLAFKNDIQFWRNKKSLEGLSVRSVFFNVFQSLIVLLYVLDNETNFIIKISTFIGLGIEIWKIHKVLDIQVDNNNKIFGVFPRLKLKDKSTYSESHTKQYDMLAFKYLSWFLFPLLIMYAIYSIVYLEHKGWYSWILNMIYGFLLTFGFIMMTPQLFINYKLKSVAHLPWRMMTYKALNTFIDDLFAFVVKMPFLYRIGCFRDDVVFLIFLYQRWIYKVDPKRINEFGISGEDIKEKEENKKLEDGKKEEEEKKETGEKEKIEENKVEEIENKNLEEKIENINFENDKTEKNKKDD